MINFDDATKEKKTKFNPKWPYIRDHPYRILIIGGSVSGKTNALLTLFLLKEGEGGLLVFFVITFDRGIQFR